MPFLLSFQIKNVIPDFSHLCALYQRCYGIAAEKKRRLDWIKRKKGSAGSFPDKKGRSVSCDPATADQRTAFGWRWYTIDANAISENISGGTNITLSVPSITVHPTSIMA